MENKELQQILFQIDADRGRTTKIRILKLLSRGRKNANEIAIKLNMKSYSHINKFLNLLYKIYLVDYDEISFSNEYKSYIKKEWFLTNLGIELIDFLKDVSLLKEITPKMFVERLKREIRNSEKYKEWKKSVLQKGSNKCIVCEDSGNSIQVHHKKSFKYILEENKIDSLEKAMNCKELFDVDNGECLCSFHHYEKTK